MEKGVSDIAALAYLAGFFDGEGCVYILRQRRKTGSHYGLEISFTNSDIAPLKRAQSFFGGGISCSKDPRPDRKPVYRLRIRSQQAANALEALLPYLLVKRERAEIGLEFQRNLVGNGISFVRHLSEEDCEVYKCRVTGMNDKIWNRHKVNQI